MFYAKGGAWLEQFFSSKLGQKRLDPTPSYIRSPEAAKRIYDHNPNAKLICCLRHPLERAFSHYWHEKKKRKYRFEFDEVLTNYDLFAGWVETGFYACHLEKYLEIFPRKQLLIQFFDDLESDPKAFMREIFEFSGVDANFLPSALNHKINVAKSLQDVSLASYSAKMKTQLDRFQLGRLHAPLVSIARHCLPAKTPQETWRSVDSEVKKELFEMCLPEIERLEQLLSVNLTCWKKP